MSVGVNYLAVLVAAVSGMVVGFLWYSPMVLGKPWMKLMGYSSADLSSSSNKKWSLLGINTGYQLVMLLVMGIVLGLMG